jgi:hypothetical protein
MHCDSQTSANDIQVTTLAIDQSPPSLGHIRLAAFLSTGEFTTFAVDPSHLSASCKRLTHIPGRGNAGSSPIVQAVYHHPLLVTLSQTFSISLYDISGDIVGHTQTLTSFTSFLPTSLVLSTPTPSTYKLVLAYAVPVYPSHWSIGTTELIISGPTPGISSNLRGSPAAISQATTEQIYVLSTRTARAFDVPQGWIDESKLRVIREQWSRKVPRVVDTQTDGKWVVVAPGEKVHLVSPLQSPGSGSVYAPAAISTQYANSTTTLQLYRLHFPSGNSIASPPKLTFVRDLHGHIGPISSLALADGRCVSLGVNGRLWVWDLEVGTGAEVSLTSGSHWPIGGEISKGMVAFDERRIVTSAQSQIIVRRFDV